MYYLLLFVSLFIPANAIFKTTHCKIYIGYADCRNQWRQNTQLRYRLPNDTVAVYFGGNAIREIRGNEFKDASLSSLKEIYLDNNIIETVHELAFNGLNNLRKVDLSHNKIQSLHPKLFIFNGYMSHLNLSFNPIASSFTLHSANLQILDLSHCKITEIGEDFTALLNLRHLNLSHNNIEDFSIHPFRKLIHLETLELQENLIKCGAEERLLYEWMRTLEIDGAPFCKPTASLLNIIATNGRDSFPAPMRVMGPGEWPTSNTEPDYGVTRFQWNIINLGLLASNLILTLIILVLFMVLLYGERGKRRSRDSNYLPSSLPITPIEDEDSPPPYTSIVI